mgnify:CR=1 FL=1
MTNEWQSLRVDRLLQHIQLEAKGLEILQKRSRSRDLTDEEIQEFEERQRVLSKASDALRIKFS